MIFLLLVIHILPRSTLFTLFWDSEVKKFIIILKFEILKSVSTTLRIVKEVVRRSSVNYTQRQSSVGVMEKTVVLRNFAKLTGKQLCQSLCFNKVSKKIDSGTGVFLCILRHFEEQLFFMKDFRWLLLECICIEV